MTRQLTKNDILNAKAIHLFNETTVYVEFNDTEDVYGSYNGTDWFIKDNFWDYWESELMLSYFEMLTPQKTFKLFEKWDREYRAKKKKENKLLNNAIEGAELKIKPEQTLRVVKVMEAAFKSHETKQVIHLDV